MSILKELNLAAQEDRSENDPIARAKMKLLVNLDSQFKAAEAMVDGEM